MTCRLLRRQVHRVQHRRREALEHLGERVADDLDERLAVLEQVVQVEEQALAVGRAGDLRLEVRRQELGQAVLGVDRAVLREGRADAGNAAGSLPVVCVALLTNGLFEICFSYREHKAALTRIQREQAEAAAAKIGQFIKEIEGQIGWTTQLPWSAEHAGAAPLRRAAAAAPGAGDHRARPARRQRQGAAAGVAARHGRGRQPAPTSPRTRSSPRRWRKKVYYGPVYFRRESEPYMTLALAGARRDAGVSVAEVNLKFIWDVVSQIKVGEHGQAYVVDAAGPADRASRHQPGAAQHRPVAARPGAGRARAAPAAPREQVQEVVRTSRAARC